jgi:hypothetical protein
MSKEEIINELKWIGAKAVMRTIKPRTVTTKISFLQAKLAVDEIQNKLEEKNNV